MICKADRMDFFLARDVADDAVRSGVRARHLGDALGAAGSKGDARRAAQFPQQRASPRPDVPPVTAALTTPRSGFMGGQATSSSELEVKPRLG